MSGDIDTDAPRIVTPQPVTITDVPDGADTNEAEVPILPSREAGSEMPPKRDPPEPVDNSRALILRPPDILFPSTDRAPTPQSSPEPSLSSSSPSLRSPPRPPIHPHFRTQYRRPQAKTPSEDSCDEDELHDESESTDTTNFAGRSSDFALDDNESDEYFHPSHHPVRDQTRIHHAGVLPPGRYSEYSSNEPAFASSAAPDFWDNPLLPIERNRFFRRDDDGRPVWIKPNASAVPGMFVQSDPETSHPPKPRLGNQRVRFAFQHGSRPDSTPKTSAWFGSYPRRHSSLDTDSEDSHTDSYEEIDPDDSASATEYGGTPDPTSSPSREPTSSSQQFRPFGTRPHPEAPPFMGIPSYSVPAPYPDGQPFFGEPRPPPFPDATLPYPDGQPFFGEPRPPPFPYATLPYAPNPFAPIPHAPSPFAPSPYPLSGQPQPQLGPNTPFGRSFPFHPTSAGGPAHGPDAPYGAHPAPNVSAMNAAPSTQKPEESRLWHGDANASRYSSKPPDSGTYSRRKTETVTAVDPAFEGTPFRLAPETTAESQVYEPSPQLPRPGNGDVVTSIGPDDSARMLGAGGEHIGRTAESWQVASRKFDSCTTEFLLVQASEHYANEKGEVRITLSCEDRPPPPSKTKKSDQELFQMVWLHLQSNSWGPEVVEDLIHSCPFVKDETKSIARKLLTKVLNQAERQADHGPYVEPATVRRSNRPPGGNLNDDVESVTIVVAPYLCIRNKRRAQKRSRSYCPKTLLQSLYDYDVAEGWDSKQVLQKRSSSSQDGMVFVSQLWCILLGPAVIITCSECPMSDLQGQTILRESLVLGRHNGPRMLRITESLARASRRYNIIVNANFTFFELMGHVCSVVGTAGDRDEDVELLDTDGIPLNAREWCCLMAPGGAHQLSFFLRRKMSDKFEGLVSKAMVLYSPRRHRPYLGHMPNIDPASDSSPLEEEIRKMRASGKVVNDVEALARSCMIVRLPVEPSVPLMTKSLEELSRSSSASGSRPSTTIFRDGIHEQRDNTRSGGDLELDEKPESSADPQIPPDSTNSWFADPSRQATALTLFKPSSLMSENGFNRDKGKRPVYSSWDLSESPTGRDSRDLARLVDESEPCMFSAGRGSEPPPFGDLGAPHHYHFRPGLESKRHQLHGPYSGSGDAESSLRAIYHRPYAHAGPSSYRGHEVEAILSPSYYKTMPEAFDEPLDSGSEGEQGVDAPTAPRPDSRSAQNDDDIGTSFSQPSRASLEAQPNLQFHPERLQYRMRPVSLSSEPLSQSPSQDSVPFLSWRVGLTPGDQPDDGTGMGVVMKILNLADERLQKRTAEDGRIAHLYQKSRMSTFHELERLWENFEKLQTVIPTTAGSAPSRTTSDAAPGTEGPEPQASTSSQPRRSVRKIMEEPQMVAKESKSEFRRLLESSKALLRVFVPSSHELIHDVLQRYWGALDTMIRHIYHATYVDPDGQDERWVVRDFTGELQPARTRASNESKMGTMGTRKTFCDCDDCSRGREYETIEAALNHLHSTHHDCGNSATSKPLRAAEDPCTFWIKASRARPRRGKLLKGIQEHTEELNQALVKIQTRAVYLQLSAMTPSASETSRPQSRRNDGSRPSTSGGARTRKRQSSDNSDKGSRHLSPSPHRTPPAASLPELTSGIVEALDWVVTLQVLSARAVTLETRRGIATGRLARAPGYAHKCRRYDDDASIEIAYLRRQADKAARRADGLLLETVWNKMASGRGGRLGVRGGDSGMNRTTVISMEVIGTEYLVAAMISETQSWHLLPGYHRATQSSTPRRGRLGFSRHEEDDKTPAPPGRADTIDFSSSVLGAGGGERIDLCKVYSDYASELRFKANRRPTRRLFADLSAAREELEALRAVATAQIRVLGDYTSALDPKLFRVTTPERQSLFHLESAYLGRQAAALRAQHARLDQLDRSLAYLQGQLQRSILVLEEGHGKAIRVFTIVSLLFLPMSFVTSFFGMNTSDIRDTDAGQAVFWTAALPVTCVVVLAAFLYGYKWDVIAEFVRERRASARSRHAHHGHGHGAGQGGNAAVMEGGGPAAPTAAPPPSLQRRPRDPHHQFQPPSRVPTITLTPSPAVAAATTALKFGTAGGALGVPSPPTPHLGRPPMRVDSKLSAFSDMVVDDSTRAGSGDGGGDNSSGDGKGKGAYSKGKMRVAFAAVVDEGAEWFAGWRDSARLRWRRGDAGRDTRHSTFASV